MFIYYGNESSWETTTELVSQWAQKSWPILKFLHIHGQISALHILSGFVASARRSPRCPSSCPRLLSPAFIWENSYRQNVFHYVFVKHFPIFHPPTQRRCYCGGHSNYSCRNNAALCRSAFTERPRPLGGLHKHDSLSASPSSERWNTRELFKGISAFRESTDAISAAVIWVHCLSCVFLSGWMLTVKCLLWCFCCCPIFEATEFFSTEANLTEISPADKTTGFSLQCFLSVGLLDYK